MSFENDENQAIEEPIDLVFILAIAGRIDAQSRLLAEKLEKDRGIYYAYAALDSLSSSYSMFKYFFDMYLANGDPNAMHDIMMTPGGIIGITIETVFLVTFSVLATHYDNEDPDSFKKMIADAWPYVRTILKGLKNAYKGWRSAVVALSLLGIIDMKALIAPIGFILGILAAANRAWSLSMVEARKVMMTTNANIWQKVREAPGILSLEKCQEYLDAIQSQDKETQIKAYLSVALGGVIDGLYLYVGVLTLASLSPPFFIAMAAICAFYTLACVVTRLYEEYDYQMRLSIIQMKCHIEILTKQIDVSYVTLLFLNAKANKTEAELAVLKRLEKTVCQYIDDFAEKRRLLKDQSTRGYASAALFGMKNGLYAYSALASVLFLVGSILVLTGTAFPPALLISCVLLGLVLMIGFTVQSLVSNYLYLSKNENKEEPSYQYLMSIRKNILNGTDNYSVASDVFRETLKNGSTVTASPQYFFQEWFEVFRSLFSGFGKGQKFVEFSCNPLQELDAQGHYQDSPIMNILALFSALFFGIVLGLRALAKGLGRKPLGQTDTEKEPQVETKPIKPIPEVVIETKLPRESIKVDTPTATDSPTSSSSFLSYFGIFQTKNSAAAGARKHFHTSHSDSDLAQYDTSSEHTVQGLS